MQSEVAPEKLSDVACAGLSSQDGTGTDQETDKEKEAKDGAKKADMQLQDNESPAHSDDLFPKFWREVSADNRQTLYGFRRFRTSHLLNLRFLEAEIDKIDRIFYQAGLSLETRSVLDRLGIKDAMRDVNPPKLGDINEALTHRLRSLIKEYGKPIFLLVTVRVCSDSRCTEVVVTRKSIASDRN